MGTLRGDNGGGERPQDGGGLPDLPPEWGTIIIPDDAGALDDEGTSIRRQFRRAAIRRRWRRRLHLRPEPIGRTGDDPPGLAVPLLIMSIAVIATLVSLFVVAWPRRNPNGTPQLAPPSPGRGGDSAGLSLFDPGGAPVPMRDLTPGRRPARRGVQLRAARHRHRRRRRRQQGPVRAGAGRRRPRADAALGAQRQGQGPRVRRPQQLGPRGGAVPRHRAAPPAAILVAADGTVLRAVSSVTTRRLLRHRAGQTSPWPPLDHQPVARAPHPTGRARAAPLGAPVRDPQRRRAGGRQPASRVSAAAAPRTA